MTASISGVWKLPQASSKAHEASHHIILNCCSCYVTSLFHIHELSEATISYKSLWSTGETVMSSLLRREHCQFCPFGLLGELFFICTFGGLSESWEFSMVPVIVLHFWYTTYHQASSDLPRHCGQHCPLRSTGTLHLAAGHRWEKHWILPLLQMQLVQAFGFHESPAKRMSPSLEIQYSRWLLLTGRRELTVSSARQVYKVYMVNASATFPFSGTIVMIAGLGFADRTSIQFVNFSPHSLSG